MHVIMSFMFFFMLNIFLVRFETEDHFCFLGTFFWHVFIDYRGIILLFFFFLTTTTKSHTYVKIGGDTAKKSKGAPSPPSDFAPPLLT